MYSYAEKISKSKMIRSDDASDDAEKLWSQPNRPFGEADLNSIWLDDGHESNQLENYSKFGIPYVSD